MSVGYIQPNSTIYLLRGVDIDKDYKHTLFATNTTNQWNKLSTYIKYTFSEQSYQRVNKNTLRIEKNANLLYDCTYLSFVNTRENETKRFYAFIDEVNYINENVTEIVYTIDVFQTYMFDYSMSNTMVIREHVRSDNLFEHIKPDVESKGEFQTDLKTSVNLHIFCGGIILNKKLPDSITVNRDIRYCFEMDNFNHIAYVSPLNSGSACYVYLGFKLYNNQVGTFPQTQSLDNIIQQIVNGESIGLSEENIITTFVFPVNFLDWTMQQVKGAFQSFTSAGLSFTNNEALQDNIYGSYTPTNKKCYTSQYNRILVSTNDGNVERYLLENFEKTSANSTTISFDLQAIYFLDPAVLITPFRYNGKSGYNYDYSMYLGNFPTPVYIGNYFNLWYNQHKSSIIYSGMMNMITGALSAVSGALVENPFGVAGGVMSATTSLVQFAGQKEDLKRRGGKGYVTGSQDYFKGVLQNAEINIYLEHLRTPFMKEVDNYFTLYGYNVSEIKVPNIYSARTSSGYRREHWNYIQTENCDIHNARCPASVKTEIENIYNKGITFWTNLSEMGNYSLNNSTVV